MRHARTVSAGPRGEGRAQRLLALGCVFTLVATLAPLVAISLFNHSYADDWHYGVWAHLVLEDTGGDVVAAFLEALRQVGVAWFDWQGTYSAIFLMAFEPGVFGEGAYVCAAWIVMGALVLATFYCAHVFLVEYLRAARSTWVCVACVTLVLQLMLQPSPVEGLFWYNSAVYYTFYHSLALVLAAQLARTLNPTRSPRPHAVARTVVATLLAAFLAGGNFVTLLVSVELGVGLLAWMLARRDPRTRLVLPPLVALFAGVAVSLVAPGNAVRQATQFPEDKLGVLQTVWESSVASFRFLSSWTCGLVVLGALFLLPLVAHAVRSPRVPACLRFSHPVTMTVASLALFASSFTPTFYSMGTEGPGRVQNCRFDLYVVLVVANVVLWAGWAARHRAAEKPEPRESAIASRVPEVGGGDRVLGAEGSMTAPREGALGHGAALACGLVALVFATNIVSMAADETSREEITSLSAANSLISGQARRYDEQVRERLDYLATTNDEYVRVPFYSDVPHVLLMGDIRDNMDNYINYRLAQWFRKQSIVGYSGDDLEADPDAASTAATPGSASSAATSTESASSSS